MELDELHVEQRRAGAQGQAHAVAGALPRVRRHLGDLADAAGGEHDGRSLEDHEVAGLAVVAERAGDRAAGGVLDQVGDGQLGEDPQPALVGAGVALGLGVVLLQRHDLLLHGADELQAGAVTDVREAGVLVAAEVALADPAVLGAVEQRAVGLELPDAVGRLLGVQLGHPPVVEELPAAHGVAEVDLPVVVAVGVAHRRGAPALGHDGVRLAEQRLADDRHPQAGLVRGDRRAQAGAAGADDEDVVAVLLDLSHGGSRFEPWVRT